jgi:DNA-binding NtrC family response regulator
VGELPLELQPKLLRALETGRVRRVGGAEVPVRVRVVAMTLRDLRREVQRGAFRADLYHRLAGFELALPPAAAARPRHPALVERFLAELAPELGPRTVEPAALARLAAHDWPGNVRELRNVIRRAALLTATRIDAPSSSSTRPTAATSASSSTPPSRGRTCEGLLALDGKTFKDLEKEILVWALQRSGGSRRRAARASASRDRRSAIA